ncbi:hypothetical protein HanPI659440_Chr04g0148421 [Helianthus annuus]|nr:hypothetical protein HanPI659440_Chr04g0148421 [Helianthus annuus]
MPIRNHNDDDDDIGLLWKLPVVYSNKLGKLGPAFGLGAGCGVGFGVGMIGVFDLEICRSSCYCWCGDFCGKLE